MKVGIHKGRYGRISRFVELYRKILEYNKIDHIILDSNDKIFWNKVNDLNLFIYRWLHHHDEHQLAKTIIPILEKTLGINCFPNMKTCWHYDDKIRQYLLLRLQGYPMIRSWIFWDRKSAFEWANNDATYPVVFKLKNGASSSNVMLVRNIKTAKKVINVMFTEGIISGRLPFFSTTRSKDFNLYKSIRSFGGSFLRRLKGEDSNSYWQIEKNYVYFQEFMPGNEYDTRVTVIGDRAFAFRRMNRKNDFRSSGSGLISYDTDKINTLFLKIAFKISKDQNYQSMAYDFLYGKNREVQFCECSYDYVDTAIFRCPGYWDSNLEWHAGNYWPQFFHLVDALNDPTLKQPEI